MTAGIFTVSYTFYVLDADWDESEHPRGDDGKFKSGSGAGKNREERGAARTKIRHLYKKKPTPAVKAQIEKLKVVSGDKAGKKDLTPGQYNANMQECKKHLLGRSYRPGKKVTSITDHSNLRSVARDIHPQKILDILRNAKNPYPGNIPHTTCYEKDSKKVVIDDAGHIVTVMHVYDGRPKNGNH